MNPVSAPSLWLPAEPLLLASASATRRSLLENAGIPVETMVAPIDERAIEDVRRAAGDGPADIAVALACAKAKAVSELAPGRIVVGADQTLALGDEAFHKPADRAAAAAQLSRLAGREHALHAGVAVARDGAILFATCASARMTMRGLSDGMVARYLDVADQAVATSVGAYQVERLGVHLFERIEGDHFTVLGLPLLPLLGHLRHRGWVAR